jgi:hypothetical protein
MGACSAGSIFYIADLEMLLFLGYRLLLPITRYLLSVAALALALTATAASGWDFWN